MTINIEQIKRECFSIISLTDQPRVAVESAIDYLHSRGYLGGVAEHVEELLKQCLPYVNEAENYELANDIDKFLGAK